MAIYKNTPPIVTSGLVLNLDSLNPQSIPLDPTVNLLGNPSPLSASAGTFSYGGGTYTISPTLTNNSMSYSVASQSLSVEITHPDVWGTFIKNTTLSNYYFDTNVSYSLSFDWKIGENTSGYNGIYQFEITNDPNTINIVLPIVLKASGSSTYSTGTLLPDGFYRVTRTFKPLNTGSISSMGFRILCNTFPTGSQRLHFFWRNLQFEKIGYNTPFISGSRTSWQDLSGNNNTATLLSSSISSSIPQYSSLNDRILNFDGTGSYALIPGNSILQPSSSITIESVFQRNSGRTIMSYNNDNSGAAKTYSFEHVGPIQGRIVTTSGITILSGPTINLNTWYHTILTYDGSLVALYLNGTLVASSTTSGSLSYATGGNLNIGRKNLTDGEYILGKVQVARVYNRALSQLEVTQNYNAIKSRFGL